MRTTKRIKLILSIAIFSIITAGCATGPDNKQNSLRPEGDAARKIMNLFSPIFWIATVIGVLVLLATIYISIKYRSTEKNKFPKQIHGNTFLEIGWTILPLVILIGVAVPTVKTIFELDKPGGNNSIQVEVVGKQWWWQFGVQTDQYPIYNSDGTPKLDAKMTPVTANEVITANELVIPVKTRIELKLKACTEDTPIADKSTEDLKATNPCNVIHSFWIPSLGGKKDVVPGRTNTLVLEADKPGLYTGQCAEFCGLSHSLMRMQVRAVTQADYDKWLDNLKKPPVNVCFDAAGQANSCDVKTVEAKRSILKFGCANCHSFDDPSSKSYAPNLTHFGSDFDNEVVGGGSIDKTQEHIWKWIHNATDWKNQNGIPMQADDCRLGPVPGEGKRCVGMPNFSVVYKSVDDTGKETNLPAMTEEEAKSIAQYLSANK